MNVSNSKEIEYNGPLLQEEKNNRYIKIFFAIITMNQDRTF